MKSMKFKWHAQMKRHELMIANFKCKTCVKKLMKLKMNKGSCIHSKDFTIQMSLFIYWLNMSTIIWISYPEKSSRVQSCSWHVCLIKLDIVFLKWNHEISISLLLSWHWWNWFEFLLETFVICFAKYHDILDLNVICLVCKAFLFHTFLFQ